jgi:hypothetical protein
MRDANDTQIVPVRIARDLVEKVDQAVASLQVFGKRYPWRAYWYGWTRSSFINKAIKEKLAKMARSRKPHRRKRIVEDLKV